MLRLIDNSSGNELKVGDYLTTDDGTMYYVTGFGITGMGSRFVEVAEMSKLAEIVDQVRPDTFDLTVQFGLENI